MDYEYFGGLGVTNVLNYQKTDFYDWPAFNRQLKNVQSGKELMLIFRAFEEMHFSTLYERNAFVPI